MIPARRALSTATLVALVALASADAGAQALTNLTVALGPGNSPDVIHYPQPVFWENQLHWETQSAVSIVAADATTFTARYAGLMSLDSEPIGSMAYLTMDSEWVVTFDVDVPAGAYGLLVETRRRGDLNLIEDNLLAADHWADITALTGIATGGTVLSGTLDLPDPGSVHDIPLVLTPITLPFDQVAVARIAGVSDGTPQTHAVSFSWSQSAFTPDNGDETAVRLGGTSHLGAETASDYPGTPARVQEADGHFVTVTLVQTCGDGVVQRIWGEECDLGADNGAGSCCTAACRLVEAGETCRPAAGACDVVETCNGVDPVCPNDHVYGDASTMGAFVCRPKANACDVEEVCDGVGVDCPPDVTPDADADMVGDACDPCTNVVPTVTERAKVKISKLHLPAGSHKLSITGRVFDVPEVPPIDPIANGVRVLVDTASAAGGVLDVVVPPGPYDPGAKVGWKRNTAGTKFTYVDRSAAPAAGLVKVVVGRGRAPGEWKFVVKGKDGTYPITAGDLPVQAILVLDPPLAATGQCAETTFAGDQCALDAGATRLLCR